MTTKPDFVYVTYIATTPEKVWQALIDTDVMRQYWVGPSSECARVNVSDWKPGSRWEHQRADGSRHRRHRRQGGREHAAAPPGVHLGAARPRPTTRRSIRGSRSTSSRWRRAGAPDRRARGPGEDPQMLAGISGGWPKVLSNLKTLLETGRALPRGAPAAQSSPS